MDVGQVIATGSTAIIGIVVGAVLTYWFGAAARRHQEEREDKTRWYDARLRAYAQLAGAARDAPFARADTEHMRSTLYNLSSAAGAIDLVGSKEAAGAANSLVDVVMEEIERKVLGETFNGTRIGLHLRAFTDVARKDLGH